MNTRAPERRSPAVADRAAAGTTATDSTPTGRQPRPLPASETLLICGLLWPREGFEPDAVLRDVRVDDVHDPFASELLGIIFERVAAGLPTEPTVVMADLTRRGAGALVRDRLIRATTAGGAAEHVREHAAGVVADALRRRVRAGAAQLAELAADGSEIEMRRAVAELAARVGKHGARLDRLRGEDSQ